MNPPTFLSQVLQEIHDSVQSALVGLDVAVEKEPNLDPQLLTRIDHLTTTFEAAECETQALLKLVAQHLTPTDRAAPPPVMHCAICTRPIAASEPHLPTMTGGVVHRVCAEQAAKKAHS